MKIQNGCFNKNKINRHENGNKLKSKSCSGIRKHNIRM